MVFAKPMLLILHSGQSDQVGVCFTGSLRNLLLCRQNGNLLRKIWIFVSGVSLNLIGLVFLSMHTQIFKVLLYKSFTQLKELIVLVNYRYDNVCSTSI